MSTPKYTPKHFKDVAEILRVHRQRAANSVAIAGAVLNIADEFADLFARVNPNFDRALFLAVVRGDKPVNARPSKKVALVTCEEHIDTADPNCETCQIEWKQQTGKELGGKAFGTYSANGKQCKATPVLDSVEQFFYDNAAYGYNPASETAEEGRKSGARKLAAAERYAKEQGWKFEWSADPDGYYCCKGCSGCPKDDRGKTKIEECVLYSDDSGQSLPLASLCGICGATPEYRRVVEAELAFETRPN